MGAADPQSRRVIIGCMTLIGSLCLMLSIPIFSLARSGSRVEAAVRASFPEFCSEWRDKIVVKPSPVGAFTTWNVGCKSGFMPGPAKMVMAVNLLTCVSQPLPILSLKLDRLYDLLIGSGQKMRVCP
jgi:hypothetical protein